MAGKRLFEYRAKRDFTKTAEPSGAAVIRPAKHLRFVIQKHDATRLHYDFRLELDGVLKSWAVTKGPSIDPSDKRLAVEVEDHPLDYGDFEGTIPKGQYGGGTVMLWDRGFWAPLGDEDPEKALGKGELKFVLAGEKLKGSWVLVRMKTDRGGTKRNNWLLIKHRDEGAKPGDNDKVLSKDRSVASGRTMSQIAAGKGKGPEPFILRRRAAKPNAVWNSSKTEDSLADPAATEAQAAAPADPEGLEIGRPEERRRKYRRECRPGRCDLASRQGDVAGGRAIRGLEARPRPLLGRGRPLDA